MADSVATLVLAIKARNETAQQFAQIHAAVQKQVADLRAASEQQQSATKAAANQQLLAVKDGLGQQVLAARQASEQQVAAIKAAAEQQIAAQKAAYGTAGASQALIDQMTAGVRAGAEQQALAVKQGYEQQTLAARASAEQQALAIKAGQAQDLAALKGGLAEQTAALKAAEAEQITAVRRGADEQAIAARRGATGGRSSNSGEAGGKARFGKVGELLGFGIDMAALGGAFEAAMALPHAIEGAAAYQSSLAQVRNNTTMTTRDTQQMDAAIRRMAASSPAALDQLQLGYMHVANFGFKAADATRILDAAQKSAVSTGGDIGATANMLANAMHEYAMGGREAAGAMDVLHLAAAQGNMTLEQMVEGGGPAIAMAANLGVPLTQVSAALAALTRHGATAGEAATYVKGILEHIVNPTKQARDELTALSAKTGIDLLADFSVEGLRTKGLTGVLADLRAAHIDAAQLFKAVPAIRGGIGAQILTGTGTTDYGTILGSLDATMAGKTSPTADAYARSQATLAFQTGVLKNNLQQLAITIGAALLPGLTRLVGALVPIIQHVTAWAAAHGKVIATAAPIALALVTIAGLALLAGPAVGLLAAAFSPLGLAVMAIVAAIGVLSVAWATNWGGIQQKVAAAWAYLQPAIKQIEQAIGAIGGAFKKGGLSGAANELMTQAGTLLGHLLAWITGTALPALAAAALRWATAFWGWVQRVTPPLLAALGVVVGRLSGWAIGTALPALAAATLRWAGALWGWVQQATPPLLGALGALLGRLGAWIIGTALPAIGAHLLRWALAFWQWVGPATASLIGHLGPLLDRLGSWIGTTALPAIGTALVGWGTAFWHWIVVAAPQMEEKLGWFLGEMIVWIPTAAVALTTKLMEWGEAFVGWIVPRAAELIANLVLFLGKMQVWIITTALPALLKLGWDMGTQLITGLITGISDAAGQVSKALANAHKGHGTHFTWGPSPGAAHAPAGAPPGSAALIAGATTINPWDSSSATDPAATAAAAAQRAAAAARASTDFATALAAYSTQSGLDPADQKRMQADIALVAKSNQAQAKHLQDLLDLATKHNHDAIRHHGAVVEMYRRQHSGGGGTGSGTGSGGGLSAGTRNAINQLTGNAPKHQTPAQIAATDFSTAMALFKAQKGLDPTDIARMRADIATIARSDPTKAAHLQALLGIALKHNHEAIAHAGAVAAHHRQVQGDKGRRADLSDATNRFKLDLLQLGASAKDHAKLLADVGRIRADEIAAHVRHSKVLLDFAENTKKVNEHFKGLAAALRTPVAPVPRFGGLAQQTGYGQTTVSFGGAQANPLQAIVAELRNQLAFWKSRAERDERVITLLEGVDKTGGLQLGVLRDISGGVLHPGPPAPPRSAHSVLRAVGSYTPVLR